MTTEIASTNPAPRIDRDRVITVAFDRSRWTEKRAENWLSKMGFKTDIKDFSEPTAGDSGYLYYEQSRQGDGRKSKWVNVGRDDKGIFAIVDAGRDMDMKVQQRTPAERRRMSRRLDPEVSTALQIASMALEDENFRQDVEHQFGMSSTAVLALIEELNEYLS